MKDKDELLTIKELAKRLKIHPETARGLYHRDRIPGIRFGHRTVRFDWDDVVAALKAGNDPAVKDMR